MPAENPPCKEPCPKCGGADVYRKYLAAGEMESAGIGETRNRSSMYVDRSSWGRKANVECLVHTCRICGYYWDTACLPALTQKET